MSYLGFEMNFNQFEDSIYGGDLESDAELLAELEALQGGGRTGNRAQKKETTVPVRREVQRYDVDVNVTEGMDEEGDIDDPDLEKELAAMLGGGTQETDDAPPPPPTRNRPPSQQPPRLPPPSFPQPSQPPPIPSRTSSAQAASKPSPKTEYLRKLGDYYEGLVKKETNEQKANRYKRTVDKCRLLEKKSALGEDIDESLIPPAPPSFHTVDSTVDTTTTPQSTVQSKENTVEEGKKERIKAILIRRRDAFVRNAKEAVAAKDKEAAKQFVMASKQFDEAIEGMESVDEGMLDEGDIPPSPAPYKRKTPVMNTPKTFEEALKSRLERFEGMAHDYKEKGDDRRYRMYSRQSASYKDAIKLAENGKVVNISDLPSLPDMPALPPQKVAPSTAPQSATAPSTRPIPSVATTQRVASKGTEQLEFVLERQRQFKQAALAAKNAGNMELAKKYLIEAKGFDKMVAACKNGLNVDISKTPIPPQVVSSKTALAPHVAVSQSSSPSTDSSTVLATLEKDLIKQIEVAENNRLRFTRLGDIAKVRQFEEWAHSAKRDLVLVREVARRGLKVPQFHREQRQIPSADFFPDLAEDVLEITILNAVDLPLPSGYEPQHANLFVKFTFPYPTDAVQSGKTRCVTGTRSPEWNETSIVNIGSKKARGQRLLRLVKRSSIKLEVLQKGSFLRSDKLIGTGELKLDGLETKAELEESTPVKEGKKALGGVVSARIRMREPLGEAKTAKNVTWLCIDV